MEALMDISYGMYVITTKYNGRNVGCFVNTVSQVTAQNPIISVSINKENYTNEVLKNTNNNYYPTNKTNVSLNCNVIIII